MKIYKITNKKTGKHYVGQTSKTLEERFKNHLKKAKARVNRYLYDSMNCHGIECFEIELLEECEKHEADDKEKYWITTLNTCFPNGYNMTSGGGGGYTLEKWDEKDRKILYKQQGNKRRGKRPDWWVESIRKASIIREASKTQEQKDQIAKKISETNKQRGLRPPLTRFSKEDHPQWVNITKDDLIECVKKRMTVANIAERFNTTKATIWAKVKHHFGEDYDYFRLRREFRTN